MKFLAFFLCLNVFAGELVFHDEFDDTPSHKPNPAFWDLDTSIKNNELQCYTDRMENVRTEGGFLVLELRKENFSCPQDQHKNYGYTSGAVQTRQRGRKDFLVDLRHGRYEIRAKVPAGRGTWPAIWLLGDGPLGKWPNSGEIDLMESVGYEEEAGRYVLYSTIHRSLQYTKPEARSLVVQNPLSENFHIYALEWTPDTIETFFDGKRVGVFKRSDFDSVRESLAWPFALDVEDTKFFLIMNLAWGGDWGGATGVDDRIFQRPVKMLVDYVRVYKN